MDNTCDGTKSNGTRNCEQRARWLIRLKDEKDGMLWEVCDRHLAQVGRHLLGGEQGDLYVRNTYTDEK
jgi:hypothetical protein